MACSPTTASVKPEMPFRRPPGRTLSAGFVSIRKPSTVRALFRVISLRKAFFNISVAAAAGLPRECSDDTDLFRRQRNRIEVDPPHRDRLALTNKRTIGRRCCRSAWYLHHRALLKFKRQRLRRELQEQRLRCKRLDPLHDRRRDQLARPGQRRWSSPVPSTPW